MRALRALPVVLSLAVFVCEGCRRAAQVGDDAGAASPPNDTSDDSGVTSNGDAGPVPDGGSSSVSDLCPPDAVPPTPDNGGLTWHPEVLPTVTAPQDAGWVTMSTDPECAALKPGPVPPRLAWNVADGGAACDPATIDGQGDLAASWINASGGTMSYVRADGSGATAIHNGPGGPPGEAVLWNAPRSSGFVLLSKTYTPLWCFFLRPLTPDGIAGAAVWADGHDPDEVERVWPNPLGGYVEMRKTVHWHPQQSYDTYSLDLRWIDEMLQPRGDWQEAVTYQKPNIQWSVTIDQQGRALVLAFSYPQSFGPPPPPSQWNFSGRWMGPSGPLTDEFQPVTPIFRPNSSNGPVLFAGWGTILPLAEGGFAVFHYQADPSYGGTISPTGWYAAYPSGQAGSQSAPSWLQLYDGALRPLAGGAGYAAAQQYDPQTCARTVIVVSPSGRTCFTIPVEGTEACAAWPDAIWPDGTLVLQDADGHSDCVTRWWPGLARPRP